VARALLIRRRMRVALLFCALLAGCYPESSDPDFEDAAAADAAPVDATIDASFADEQALRAFEVLFDLQHRLPGLLVDGHFPVGTQGFTPGTTCCASGDVLLCPSNPASWQGLPLWDALELWIVNPHAHVYSGVSDGNMLTVTARGDLDCDGTFADMRLTCLVTSGVVECVITRPAVNE
jgi:hypothetical protein